MSTIPKENPSIEEVKRYSFGILKDFRTEPHDFPAIFRKILTLLEIFKRQVYRLDRLGYCDHELAYLSFECAQGLIDSMKTVPGNKFASLLTEIQKTQDGLRSSMAQVRSCFEEMNPIHFDLESRYGKLKDSSASFADSRLNFKRHEFLSPSDLNSLLRSSKDSVLIIDFRSKKEYAYSHINYSSIVNIEPQIVTEVYEKNASVTDSDLERVLEKTVGDEELKMFRRRHTYDWVIMYNLRYGLVSDSIYKAIKSLLKHDNNDVSNLSKNPFQKLVDLLMFRTQFLSSRLKNYPLFLNGGLERWYKIHGDGSLMSESSRKSNEQNSDVRLAGSFEKGQSKYIRSFQDYLTNSSVSARSQVSFKDKIVSDKVLAGDISQFEASFGQTSSCEPPKLENSGSKELERFGKSHDSHIFSTGLVNLGNSCYMNCILQCLAATPYLANFLIPSHASHSESRGGSFKEHINLDNTLGSRGVVTVMFSELLDDMLRNKSKSFAPTKFKKVVGSLSPGKQFANNHQQDCNEFLNFMLDSLHEDLNQRSARSLEERRAISELSEEQEKVREFLPVRLASSIEWERYLKLNFSMIVDLFQGQYVSQLRCLECQMTSSTYNSFSTLSLPIPEKLGKSASSISLSDCLDLFVETELLEDDNKWHCPKCKRFTKSTKKLVISRLPRVLIIHFKRFKIKNGLFQKLDNFIDYPVSDCLDLTKYWPPVGTYISPAARNFLSESKERELLAELPDRLQTAPFRYELYGVVNHYGNLTTGHYTSFVKKANNDWCYFDDAKVSRGSSESKVLNQNAYCLFYRRI